MVFDKELNLWQLSGQTVWMFGRHEFLYLAWAAMEITLLAPLTLALMPWARYWPAGYWLLWLLTMMLIPFNLVRVMSLYKISLFKQQNLLLVGFGVTFCWVLRTLLYAPAGLFDFSWLGQFYSHISQSRNPFLGRDIAIFFITFLIWWRGIALTGRKIDINELGLRLRVGGLLLLPLVVAVSFPALRWQTTFFVLLFFLAALLAIALTRAEQISQESSGRAYPMSPRWMGMIFLTSLFIVSLAGLFGLGFGSENLPAFVAALRPGWEAFVFFITVFTSTVTYLTIPLFAPLQWLFDFLRNFFDRILVPFAPPTQESEGFSPPPFEAMIQWLTRPPTQLAFWVNRTLLFLLFITILFILLLALERFFRQRRLVAEANEQLLGGEEEVELSRPGLAQRLLQRLGLFQQWRAAASIRRIYRQMCQAAAASGFPRTEAETPNEYLVTLQKVWPAGHSQVQLITQAFIKVRYGELPETKTELQAIHTAWHFLEQHPPKAL